MRTLVLFAITAFLSTLACAQNTSANAPQPLQDQGVQLSSQEQEGSDHGQRIQRIVVEDAGSRVDELRVGGQTKSITVQPKTGNALPPYEVRPSDGTRLWNLGRF